MKLLVRRKPNPKSPQKSEPEENVDLLTETKTLGPAKETDKAPPPQSTISSDLPDSYLGRKRLDGKLKLEKLALERVTLSIIVCSRAIDWSNLTNLTILSCRHHESLWKALKRQFQPAPPAHGSPQGTSARYHLSLKHLSTDAVSPELLSFMKEAIAPNTMETIFLQDRQRTSKPSVTLEQVFKCTVKRHRNSLKKLLIDSSEKKTTNLIGVPGRWKHWAIRDEFLSYITSGRMASLRELGMVIDVKDWVSISFISHWRFVLLPSANAMKHSIRFFRNCLNWPICALSIFHKCLIATLVRRHWRKSWRSRS